MIPMSGTPFDSPRPLGECSRCPRRRPWASVAASGTFVLLTLSGCGARGPRSEAIAVTANSCAHGWRAPHSGPATFEVTNHNLVTVDVQLRSTGGQLAFAEIPTLGPGTTRPLTVTLAPGNYIWQCASLANVIYESNPEQVKG